MKTQHILKDYNIFFSKLLKINKNTVIQICIILLKLKLTQVINFIIFFFILHNINKTISYVSYIILLLLTKELSKKVLSKYLYSKNSVYLPDTNFARSVHVPLYVIL